MPVFQDGSQYVEWFTHNCDNCRKCTENPTCDIDIALMNVTVFDCAIPDDIAKRSGYTGSPMWDCLEREDDNV